MVNRDHAERLRVKLGFEGLFHVDNVGRSGGFALLWGVTIVDWIEERLDRVVANGEWRGLHEGARVYCLETDMFDHAALFLDVYETREVRRHKGFRFENAWLLDEECGGVVREAWGETGNRSLHEKLALCGERLEDMYWKQRAKQHWLREGDRNTRCFHLSVSNRKRKNRSLKLRDGEGSWVEGQELDSLVVRYYEGIFTSGGCRGANFFDNLRLRVTGDMNIELLRPFRAEEDVTEFFLGCLETGQFPSELNTTNIVLIPKKKVPELVSDLRPIALCNVVYKVMAKMLANRMKNLLKHIVSKSESAFLPGRLITDNILVAAEVRHYLRRKTTGEVGWAALKLDMAKAYDKMEWEFLNRMLLGLGFGVWGESMVMWLGRWFRRGGSGRVILFHLTCSFFVSRAYPYCYSGSRTEEGYMVRKRRCLREYEELSGQSVNFEKSNISFSRNTMVETRTQVANLLGVNQADDISRYLGLPSVVGRNRRAVFAYFEEKLVSRIGAWNKKFLSQAGKEILLKTVAQAMPLYAMSLYPAPQSTQHCAPRASQNDVVLLSCVGS
ncbi:PREDICTED: uncharacterized protein LOC109153826 [Ipomoea nil]|uniref:uncharacterized protein LOC109153826 n=1 Tax=Ipomoea nil TaxID=35883 RepID=UPI000900EA54|nr:PREDICTED: uncharacterized protein LOC109153826 [Ipomoea nil]